MKKRPVVLTIAGSDSGAGAGIQADLKTFSALGCYGVCSITSVTAQNTLGVRAIENTSLEVVASQIDAVCEDFEICATKTGMLPTDKAVNVVAEKINEHNLKNVVVDPVMVATSGDELVGDQKKFRAALLEKLIPLASLFTPNIYEAEVLLGVRIKEYAQMCVAAEKLFDLTKTCVVVKGGHLNTKESCYNVLVCEGGMTTFASKRHPSKNTHGTGCTFASAIASYLAKNKTLKESLKQAQDYVYFAIENAYEVGKGSGPLNHFYGAI